MEISKDLLVSHFGCCPILGASTYKRVRFVRKIDLYKKGRKLVMILFLSLTNNVNNPKLNSNIYVRLEIVLFFTPFWEWIQMCVHLGAKSNVCTFGSWIRMCVLLRVVSNVCSFGSRIE